MKVGQKYISAVKFQSDKGHCAFIFLGFVDDSETQGFFVKDDQELFDFLGEPYSQEAVNRIDFFNAKKGKITIYTFDCHDKSEWRDVEMISRQTEELQEEMKSLSMLRSTLSKKSFYECDCPNGSVYNEFISEFKKRCSDKGLSTRGFTFHGVQGRNELHVCHNNYEVREEDDNYAGVTQASVFFDLEKDPKYIRISTSFCCGTSDPEI